MCTVRRQTQCAWKDRRKTRDRLHGPTSLYTFVLAPNEKKESADPAHLGGEAYIIDDKRGEIGPFPPTLTVGGDESAIRVGGITWHLHPKFTISSSSLLLNADTSYPARLFSIRPLRWLPLLPQNRTPCRPSMIKTRASGSPSKRLETCGTAVHNPQVQIPFVCTTFLIPSPEPRFHHHLPRS